jgi:hypothetical protein
MDMLAFLLASLSLRMAREAPGLPLSGAGCDQPGVTPRGDEVEEEEARAGQGQPRGWQQARCGARAAS